MNVAIIAAGGKGKRTGLSEYTSKAALSVGGKTLLERQIDFAMASGCGKSIVVARPEHVGLLAGILPEKDHKVVFVPAREEPNGWAGRIEQALPWVRDGDQVLILSCDNVQTVSKAEWPWGRGMEGGAQCLFTTTRTEAPTTDGPVFGLADNASPNIVRDRLREAFGFENVSSQGFRGLIFTGYITVRGQALRDALWSASLLEYNETPLEAFLHRRENPVKPSARGEKEITSLLEVISRDNMTVYHSYDGEYLDVADLESLARIHAKLTNMKSDGPVDVGAGVILRSQAGAVLLTERQDGRGWVMPGGLVDRGEPYVRAASREMLEEISVHVPPEKLRLLGVYPAPGKDGPAVSVIFHAEVPAIFHPHLDPKEARTWTWFNKDTVRDITIPFNLRAAVDDALAGHELDVRGYLP